MHICTHRDKGTCFFNMSSKETQWGIILKREGDQSMRKLLLPSCDLCGHLAGQHSVPIYIQAKHLHMLNKNKSSFLKERKDFLFLFTGAECADHSQLGPWAQAETLQWQEHVAESCHSVTNGEQRDLALTFSCSLYFIRAVVPLMFGVGLPHLG